MPGLHLQAQTATVDLLVLVDDAGPLPVPNVAAAGSIRKASSILVLASSASSRC